LFGNLPFNVAEENIQSRVRGNLVMAIANKFNYILLNTSNKSELSTGYGTLYGDMAGGLGVLGDCYKLQVYALARYINKDGEVIPENIITKPPSAELRPGQKAATACRNTMCSTRCCTSISNADRGQTK
jgi:NH(3)-dependent NAD(+) synthetase (EC 6.3.1.5)